MNAGSWQQPKAQVPKQNLYLIAVSFCVCMCVCACVCVVQRESSRVSLRRSAEIKVRADVQMASMMESVDTSQTVIKQPLSARGELTLQSAFPLYPNHSYMHPDFRA